MASYFSYLWFRHWYNGIRIWGCFLSLYCKAKTLFSSNSDFPGTCKIQCVVFTFTHIRLVWKSAGQTATESISTDTMWYQSQGVIRNWFSPFNQKKEGCLSNQNALLVGVEILRTGYSVNPNECRNLYKTTGSYFFRLAAQSEGLEVLET